MKTKLQQSKGGVLVAVVLFSALLAALAAGLLVESGSHHKMVFRQISMDQALSVAEGGMERAVAHLVADGAAPVVLNGVIGQGSYETLIRFSDEFDAASSATPPGTHTVGGSLKINPNSLANNEFFLIKPDGRVITRTDLNNDRARYASAPCVFYQGPAKFIHVKPGGSGSQSTLMVDGAAYAIANSSSYEFDATGLYTRVYNTARDASGKPSGDWMMDSLSGSLVGINGDGGSGDGSQALAMYSVVSKGMIGDLARVVYIDGLHQRSWAKYALWYNSDPVGLVFTAGEKFYGPVHGNTKFKFLGDPEFFDTCSSTRNSYDGSTNDCVFHKGFSLNAPSNSLLSINFTNLMNQAGMVLAGYTHIRLNTSNMVVKNTRAGWTNWTTNAFPANGLIYVKDATNNPTSTKKGNVYLSGTLDGRLTIASDYDILITNHVRYATHPTNSSTDALGLLAMRNVLIDQSCPNNIDVFAHIIASGKSTPTDSSDGSFWVTNYDKGSGRGELSVYGGIVQDKRGPVGTVNSSSGAQLTGFKKNYTYDTRFADNPPPFYPTLTNEYQWKAWREIGQ